VVRLSWFVVQDSHLIHIIAGSGRCLVITDVDGPSAFPVVPHMNFEPEVRSSAIMSTLNWATVDEDYTPRESCLFMSDRYSDIKS
jgi:hypothetical protein